MKLEALVEARKLAEASVADMADGPPKVAAFQTILTSLLERVPTEGSTSHAVAPKLTKNAAKSGDGPRGRILSLATDGFFAHPKSLPEIQEELAQRGWHYAQQNLGTPLTRLVRDHSLRRLRTNDGVKKLWKYSMY
jgi:uncharacterized protein (DUF2236 family)